MGPKHENGKDPEGYRQMAHDEAREAEALEWSEGTIGDVADTLIDDLLESNAEFRAMAAKSKASPRKPFVAGSGE